VPRILIDLTDAEYKVLLVDAKRERRTPQAQAAVLLVSLLEHRAMQRTGSAEADRPPLGAGGALPAQQDVGAEQGHGDGPAAGVNEVVVGGPGEPQ
jgi:hypothetical protein